MAIEFILPRGESGMNTTEYRIGECLPSDAIRLMNQAISA
jgi:hypothetical protein